MAEMVTGATIAADLRTGAEATKEEVAMSDPRRPPLESQRTAGTTNVDSAL